MRSAQRGIISVVRFRPLLLAILFALILPTSAGAVVNAGTIQVNRGAAGIRLGMTRATVVSKLGTPIFQNGNGYMQYSENNIFDLYLNRARRVRMLGVSGPNFCTRSGICMFDLFGVRKLKNQWGSRLKLLRRPCR